MTDYSYTRLIPNGIAPSKKISCSLTAQNQFSTDIDADTPQASTGLKGTVLYGEFLLELSGTWSATVTVQRSIDNGVTFNDVTTGLGTATAIAFTTNGQWVGYEPTRGVLYRFGAKTGNYTSGTIVGRLEQ